MRSLCLAVLATLAFVAAAPSESPYEPLVVVQPLAEVVRPIEARALINDVNQMRAAHGLAGVDVDRLLSQAALAHAKDMASRRFFGHITPEGGSLPDRLARVGFHWKVAAENIALDANEHRANAALVQSAPHRANILDPRVHKIGAAALRVGVDAELYVEDFAE